MEKDKRNIWHFDMGEVDPGGLATGKQLIVPVSQWQYVKYDIGDGIEITDADGKVVFVGVLVAKQDDADKLTMQTDMGIILKSKYILVFETLDEVFNDIRTMACVYTGHIQLQLDHTPTGNHLVVIDGQPSPLADYVAFLLEHANRIDKGADWYIPNIVAPFKVLNPKSKSDRYAYLVARKARDGQGSLAVLEMSKTDPLKFTQEKRAKAIAHCLKQLDRKPH